jgi:two-component SAPR family response regulator
MAGDAERALTAGLAALELYRGELLGEAGPAEWVVAERDRLRVAAAETAYAAGRLSLRLRPPPEALALARRATELDPLRDSAWGLLAEVQERMGDRGSAAATRREHALVTAQLAGP